jgi:DNA-binding XRE family transcriptional regulator
MNGNDFRKWRRINDLTQDMVANDLGIDKSTISRWEHELISISDSLYNKLMDYKDSIVTSL